MILALIASILIQFSTDWKQNSDPTNVSKSRKPQDNAKQIIQIRWGQVETRQVEYEQPSTDLITAAMSSDHKRYMDPFDSYSVFASQSTYAKYSSLLPNTKSQQDANDHSRRTALHLVRHEN